MTEQRKDEHCRHCFAVIVSGLVFGFVVFVCGVAYGRKSADPSYTAMICGDHFKTVVYGKYINANWILFQVKDDQPRVINGVKHKCRLVR